MKKLILLLLLLFRVASAQEVSDTPSLAELRNEQKFFVNGGSIVDYHYEEPGVMRIQGRLTRFETGYRHAIRVRDLPAWWAVDASFAYGNLTYYGETQKNFSGTITPVTYPTMDNITTLRGRFGFPMFDNGHRVLNVYLGLATWVLNDDSIGVGSYGREIIYLYVPVGAEYVMKAGAFSWVSSLEYNPQILGIVKSNLSEASPAYSDATTIQILGFGLKASTGVEINTGPVSITAEIFYQFWSMDASSTDTQVVNGQTLYLQEPKNDTEMLGANLGVRF